MLKIVKHCYKHLTQVKLHPPPSRRCSTTDDGRLDLDDPQLRQIGHCENICENIVKHCYTCDILCYNSYNIVKHWPDLDDPQLRQFGHCENIVTFGITLSNIVILVISSVTIVTTLLNIRSTLMTSQPRQFGHCCQLVCSWTAASKLYL